MEKIINIESGITIYRFFNVPVDKNQCTESATESIGIRCRNDNINNHTFPKPVNGKKEELEIDFFGFDKIITPEKAEEKIDKEGYHPGIILHLTDWYKTLLPSDPFNKLSILVLGSKYKLGNKQAAIRVYTEKDMFSMDLTYLDIPRSKEELFLVVKKEQEKLIAA